MPFLFFVPVVFVAFCCCQPSALIKTASFLSFSILGDAASSLLCSLSSLLPFPSHFFGLFLSFPSAWSPFLFSYPLSSFFVLYPFIFWLILSCPFVTLCSLSQFFLWPLPSFLILYHSFLSLVILCYPLSSGFCPSCPFLSFGLLAQGLALEEEGMGVKEEAQQFWYSIVHQHLVQVKHQGSMVMNEDT